MDNQIFSFRDTRMIFKNFRGEERQFNTKGDRNFNLVLTKEQADGLIEEGFNVKVRPPRDEDEDPQYLLAVSVSYKIRPPKVMLITSRNKTDLTEETIGELDYAEIEYLDVTIRPYHWSMPNGRSGVKAYLNSLYATLLEDEFADKYRDIPDRE